MPTTSIQQALSIAAEHREARRFGEAEWIYARVLEQLPGHPQVLHELAQLHLAAQRPEQALLAIEQALLRKAGDPALLNTLSVVLRSLHRFTEAGAASEAAIASRPDEPVLHCNLGLARLASGRAAEAAWRQALRLDPRCAPAWFQLGLQCAAQRRFAEAHDCFQSAVSATPGDAVARYNLALAQEKLGQFAAARTTYERSVALDPQLATAWKNLTFCILREGDLARGWELYERRFDAPDFPTSLPRLREPLWDGGDIRGRTILLRAEQGFGDNIQFARFASVLGDLGARVVIESLAPLHELFLSLPGVARVLAPGEVPPAFDVHCALLSVAHRLRTTLATIPASVPYLTAPTSKIAQWRERLGERREGELRIGLAWAGNPAHGSDSERSCAIEHFAPLTAIPGARFISLQKELPPGFSPSPAILLEDFHHDIASFADTAAIIENVDVVVSVDTAVAHLAGALGRPIGLLLSATPEWRWLLGRDDSPWYPTMRLFRQSALGDWPPVITQLAAWLRQMRNIEFHTCRPPVTTGKTVQARM